MFEAVKVKNYVSKHKAEIDRLMVEYFEHWNKVGQIDKDVAKSNKMQVIFLVSIIRTMLTTSGMPKDIQKNVLKELLAGL